MSWRWREANTYAANNICFTKKLIGLQNDIGVVQPVSNFETGIHTLNLQSELHDFYSGNETVKRV